MQTFSQTFLGKTVLRDTGEDLGEVSSLLFSPSNKKISGLVIKKHLFSYDYFSLGEIIKQFQETITIHQNDKKPEHLEHLYDIIGKKVKNELGDGIGTVVDIEFDEFYVLKSILVDSYFSMVPVEILSPFLIRINKDLRKIPESSVIAYQQKAIIVQELIHSKPKQKFSALEVFPAS